MRLISFCVLFAFVYVQDVDWYEYMEEDNAASEPKGAKCDTHGTVYERLTASGAYDGTAAGWEKFCNDYNAPESETKALVITMSARHRGDVLRNTVKPKAVTSKYTPFRDQSGGASPMQPFPGIPEKEARRRRRHRPQDCP